jgi:two-component sensor histidine kinase
MWQSGRPTVVRWVASLALFAVAITTRVTVGTLHVAAPAFPFIPILIIIAMMFGWKEAIVILCLSVGFGWYMYLPSDLYFLPMSWLVVGSLLIATIAALKSLALELAAANQRQQLLFRESQHRVANSLQAGVTALEVARQRMETAPEQVTTILSNSAYRMAASAEVHRRLNDPDLFKLGLDDILRDAVAAIVGPEVQVDIYVEPLDLSFDQMSILTMMVIEISNSAEKHVFARDLGDTLYISLQKVADRRGLLLVKDNGPAWSNDLSSRDGLGLNILQGLAKQFRGEIQIKSGGGTVTSVNFPLK